MMKKLIAASVAATMLMASPAVAGWKLVSPNTSIVILKSKLSVTPAHEWNRQSKKLGKFSEAWTMDGVALNEVVFYTGVPDGETLIKDRKKKTQPIPKFSKTMLIPDVSVLYEQTLRVTLNTPVFELTRSEPFTFAGQPGFRFNFNYVGNDEVKRNGEAVGAIIGGQLYMITYTAADIYYYDRDLEMFRQLVSTVKVG